MFEPVSSTKTRRAASILRTIWCQIRRRSSSRSVAPSVFFSRPAQSPNGTAHGGGTDAHALALCPETTVFVEGGIGMRVELRPEGEVVLPAQGGDPTRTWTGGMLPVARRNAAYRLTVERPTPKTRSASLLLMPASTAAKILLRRPGEYACIT